MDNQLREQVLNEAIRIGDKLLERAERDENGIFWQTLQSEGRGNYSKGVSVTLYDGVPGIAVFLMQLFQMTQSQKYLDAARGGMDWSVEHSRCNPSDNFALFTGRMGVCFALKRLFEVTHESEYMEQALSIAKGAEQFVSSNNSRNDLLNGRAGTLLGLLHLDALSQEQWITPLIELGIEQLIDQSHDGPTGLYWDRSPDQIHGLCGFSHGSAGVGYAWLEMGRHFRNPTFYWLAEQSFAYESHYFDRDKKVWPDFRKGIWRTSDLDAHRKAFLEGDFDFFTKSGDLNVWCHGAAGIGLSRLRAYELLGNPEHRNDALTALETCRWINEKVVSQKVSFTLCHGIGGVVELFLEAYLRWNAEDCLALSADVVERILKAREAQGIYRCGYSDCRPQEDSSLFNGDAGIGYLCLRVLDPLHTPSVLMPVVADSLKLVGTGHFSVGERFTLPRVKEMILQKTFPRTVQSLKGSLPVSFTEFLRVDGIPADTGEIDRFVAFVKELLPGLTNDGIELLQPAFGIELEKVSMDRSVVSNALIRMKELVLRESAVGLFRLDTEDFLRAVLVLDGAARVIDIHSDSPSSDGRSKGNAEDEVLNQERDGSAVLLKALPTYVAEIPLSALSGRIVRAFVEEKTVGGAIDEIAGDYDCELGQKGKEVRLVLLDQIKEALKAGILIPPQVPSRVN